jgi:hypothetical protein
VKHQEQPDRQKRRQEDPGWGLKPKVMGKKIAHGSSMRDPAEKYNVGMPLRIPVAKRTINFALAAVQSPLG